MKTWLTFISLAIFTVSHMAEASQADDTEITITAKTQGPTSFINQLTLLTSDTSLLRSIQFTITPKPASVTRPLSATYSSDYLTDRGYVLPATGTIFLPVYGLYAAYTNTVTLTYTFLDGSSKEDSTTITTPVYDDPCDYGNPTVLQGRTASTALSFDFFLVRERCSGSSPTILDSDSNVRWVGPAGIYDITSAPFENAFYQANGRGLNRIDFDGTITFLHDYADAGVTYLHHNIDRGKVGLILDADTPAYFESTNIEVDTSGNVLKTWSLAEIISAAMIAGGDDPGEFVYPSPADWFHNNSVAYNRSDDSLIISSRENFVICIDYETGTIKWILGDPTKKWYQFPSLRQYALTLPNGTNPPIGQHTVSIAYDQNLLLFDNGFASWLQMPPGAHRSYSGPRKYQIDLPAKTATEIWNYTMGESTYSSICGGVYEDAPQNYLIDYAFVYDPESATRSGQVLGLDASGTTVFHYQYPNVVSFCDVAYNSIPLHLESTKFPAVGPKALNLSTRGTVSNGDDTLIGGFIVSGDGAKKVALRVLGPSLTDAGLKGVVADPTLILYDSTGNVIAANDDWASDPGAAELRANGLAPTATVEAATVQTLAPAAYTVVSRSKDETSGLGLVEAYDLTAETDSRLANISTRGSVGIDDNLLIGGFIVGDLANAPVILRGLGPSLGSAQVSNALADPVLSVHDQNGTVIAMNDNWQDDVNSPDVEKNGLAPGDPAESAIVLNLPAGAYSAVVSGANGSTGTSLVEVYNLN